MHDFRLEELVFSKHAFTGGKRVCFKLKVTDYFSFKCHTSFRSSSKEEEEKKSVTVLLFLLFLSH